MVNFDKKFNNVAKYKQEEILYFAHISAKKLKEYKLNSNGDVKILSTGNYEGFTNYIQNDSNINYGEIISIPSGGSPILKYYKGYFIDSLNILFSSKNTSKINLKFIYYFLINDIFFIEENFRGSSIKHPNMSTIIEINIPLPSIEVQNKIVNILDKLQDYSKDIKTGLPLEIEQRQKQYEYYRNLLLDFKANAQGGALANNYIELLNSIYKELFYSFEYKSLDKICDVKIGEFIHKHFQNSGEKSIYPVFNGGIENTGYYEKYNYHDKVIISARGANAGFVNYVKTKFWAGNSCYVLFINNVELNSKYLYYQLKNKQENLNHIKTSASIPAISKKQVENFIIPIPSLEVQNKIVEILDKLYDYSKNLKDGLPLEIKQRKNNMNTIVIYC